MFPSPKSPLGLSLTQVRSSTSDHQRASPPVRNIPRSTFAAFRCNWLEKARVHRTAFHLSTPQAVWLHSDRRGLCTLSDLQISSPIHRDRRTDLMELRCEENVRAPQSNDRHRGLLDRGWIYGRMHGWILNSRREQSRAEQSGAERSRAEQSRASRALRLVGIAGVRVHRYLCSYLHVAIYCATRLSKEGESRTVAAARSWNPTKCV